MSLVRKTMGIPMPKTSADPSTHVFLGFDGSLGLHRYDVCNNFGVLLRPHGSATHNGMQEHCSAMALADLESSSLGA